MFRLVPRRVTGPLLIKAAAELAIAAVRSKADFIMIKIVFKCGMGLLGAN